MVTRPCVHYNKASEKKNNKAEHSTDKYVVNILHIGKNKHTHLKHEGYVMEDCSAILNKLQFIRDWNWQIAAEDRTVPLAVVEVSSCQIKPLETTCMSVINICL